MPTFTSNNGVDVTIEQNDDGSFSVSNDNGDSRDYGADVAGNIYQDWDLHGVDLSEANVPSDPDAADRDEDGDGDDDRGDDD
jgi:hypothetical protein